MENTNLTSGDAAAILAFLATYLVIVLIVWIVLIVANWKIFTKAGEPGWKSIIPVYGSYIGYKIAWKPMMFWVTIGLSIATSVCNNLATQQGSSVATVIAGVLGLASFAIYCLWNQKLAKSFQKGGGFTLGLIFLNPIFKLILGFGSAEYIGPQE